jgi:hypothetical protein
MCYAGSGLYDQLITRSEESYCVCLCLCVCLCVCVCVHVWVCVYNFVWYKNLNNEKPDLGWSTKKKILHITYTVQWNAFPYVFHIQFVFECKGTDTPSQLVYIRFHTAFFHYLYLIMTKDRKCNRVIYFAFQATYHWVSKFPDVLRAIKYRRHKTPIISRSAALKQ